MRATPAGGWPRGWKSRRREQGAGVIPRDWAKGAFVLKRAAPSCPSGDVHFGDRLRRRLQHSSYATCPFATIPQRRTPPLPGACRHGGQPPCDRPMAERPGGTSVAASYIDGGSHAGHPIPQGGCEAGEGLDAARNMDARRGDHRGQRTPARLTQAEGRRSQPDTVNGKICARRYW